MGVPLRGSRVGHFVRFDRFGRCGHIDQFDRFFLSGHFGLGGQWASHYKRIFPSFNIIFCYPSSPVDFQMVCPLHRLETCAGIINNFCNFLQNKKKFPGRDRSSPFSPIFAIILAKSYFIYLNYSLRLADEQTNADIYCYNKMLLIIPLERILFVFSADLKISSWCNFCRLQTFYYQIGAAKTYGSDNRFFVFF